MKTRILFISIIAVVFLALTACTAQVTTTTLAVTGTNTTPVTPATGIPSTAPTSAGATTFTSTSTQAPAESVSPGSVAALEATVENIYSQVNSSVVNVQVLLSGSSTTLPSNHPTITPTPALPFSAALGSGIVWDTDGRIITNNHVVEGASRTTVTFFDGTTVEGTVVGTDPDSDLAVIKVNMPAGQLHPVKVADSSQLKVGQLAVAIGNPFGLQGTMTVGFISAVGRVIPNNSTALGPSYSIPDIIQTDAAINPGNSGGALLDSSGSLIGITYSIDTTSGSSSGVGFAIPSSIVKQVVPALIQTGHYDHPYLGVSIVSMNPDLAAAMNLPANQRGAMVQAVTPGGPADKAGLRASNRQVTINGLPVSVGGDIVTAYNDQAVKTTDDLIALLARSGVISQAVTLTILRNSQQMQVQVTPTARPATTTPTP